MTDTQLLYQPVTGCAVTAQGTPNMTVAVASGTVLVANVLATVSAANVTITAADLFLDRIDAIVSDNTGTLSAIVGTLNDGLNVRPPDTTGYCPLAYVYVINQSASSYTGSITSGQITDARVFNQLPEPAQTFAYTFTSGALSNADPGAGNFGFNSATLSSITAAYVNYTSPTASTHLWFLPTNFGSFSLAPYLIRLWSRKNPANWMELEVTATANHGTGGGTYAELTCTVVRTSTSGTSPTLATDVLDTVFQYVGPYVTPGLWLGVSKKAVTSRNSTTALTADPDLQFAMSANTNYIIRGLLRFDSASATPGFKFDLDGPAAPTNVAVVIYDAAAGAIAPGFIGVDNAFNVARNLATAGSVTTFGIVHFEVLVENGSNAGTFSIRWAQNTSNGTNVNVRAGSYLEYATS